LRQALSVLRFACVLVLLFAVAPQFFGSFTTAESGKDEATSALAGAEGGVVSAYQAVLGAEGAGADVSGLLVRLNEAGELLTRARMAYKVDDFESALGFAVQCREKLNGFVVEANALRDTAVQERYLDFMFNVVGSVIGAVTVVCASFVSWFFLKRKYETGGSVAK